MSDRPHGLLTPAEYQTAIRREADDLLAALARGDETAHVPACPDWTVRELVVHLGKVHLWAGVNAKSQPDAMAASEQPGPDDADLASWYRECVDGLLRTLDDTDPDTPCWTFQPGHQVAGFWYRRQAQELAMHRSDVEVALGSKYRYDPALAADGIGEVFDVFLYRRTKYGVPPLELAVPLLVECTDRAERWLVEPVPGSDNIEHHALGPVLSDERVDTAAAALRGSAAGLLFTFWKRQDLESAELTPDGDTALAEWFAGTKLTP